MSFGGPVISIQPTCTVSGASTHFAVPNNPSRSLMSSPSGAGGSGPPGYGPHSRHMKQGLGLLSASRDRAYSAGEMSQDTSPIHYRSKSKPQSPLAQAYSSQMSAPTQHSLAPNTDGLSRSFHSLPRNMRSVSAEPERDEIDPAASLPPMSPTRRTPLSGRFMKRAQTIDTNQIYREDFEEYTQLNQYKVMDIIGHGSYGLVRRATDDNDELYAMKMLGKKRLKRKGFLARPKPGSSPKIVKSPLDNVKREIAILKKLDHPNVVKLYEVLDDPQEDDLILVFEYIPNGCVINKLPMEHPYTEEKSREYFIDLILGLEYLHSQHVIHRDIKPQNLLLDNDDSIKIADFGVSEEIEQSEALTSRWAGTPAFVAPECLDVTKSAFRGQAVDIWASGITLYCFLFGKVPWSPPSVTELYDLIKTEEVPIPDDVTISAEARDLLVRLLNKDPAKRITIPEIREHPWVLKTTRPLPSKEENCQEEISVSEEEIKNCFKRYSTPIHILVMLKQMAKKRSLSRPFSSPRNSPKNSPSNSPTTSPRRSHGASVAQKGITGSGKREKFAQSRNTPSIFVDNADEDVKQAQSHQ